jgi:hypothetical protein
MKNLTDRQTDKQVNSRSSSLAISNSSSIANILVNPLSFYVLQAIYGEQRIKEDFIMSEDMINTSFICSGKTTMKGENTMNNIINNNVKESKGSNAMGLKPTVEQVKVMQEAKVKAENEAKVKAENEAKVKAENEAKVKAETLNPYFTELMKSISFTLQEDITSKLSELFQDTMLRDMFFCFATVDKESHRFIAIAHKAKIENKNSILRSYTLIPENKNLSEIRLTVRRRFANNDFKYSVISCNNKDDHKVMLTSQLGKERIGTSYEEEKEKLEKNVNAMLDKLVKFTESHSKVNVIGKNQKEVREIRKAINKLIALIDNNR